MHSEPPRVAIKSPNPTYESYAPSAEKVRVIGRDVWVSRRL